MSNAIWIRDSQDALHNINDVVNIHKTYNQPGDITIWLVMRDRSLEDQAILTTRIKSLADRVWSEIKDHLSIVVDIRTMIEQVDTATYEVPAIVDVPGITLEEQQALGEDSV